MTINLPLKVTRCFKTWFNFPVKSTYAQIVTMDSTVPTIRTMMLYDITPNGEAVFLSRLDSRKWSDLAANPNISFCLYHEGHGQLVAEGKAHLYSIGSTFEKFDRYWQSMPLFAKKIYVGAEWLDKDEIPKNFGVIVMSVKRWEVLEINLDDYVKSSRREYRQIDGKWQEKCLQAI